MRLLIIIVITLIVGFLSLHGWRFWRRTREMSWQADVQLVQRLQAHVYRLAEEIGERSVFKYEKLQEAKAYISAQLASFGYKLEYEDYYITDKMASNIIAVKPGIEFPKEIVIVGAHYDTCFNPGADDNASAVAGLLELARQLQEQQTKRTIRFIAFVNEEPPFFKTEQMGSRVYSRQIKQLNEDIKAVVILEMIGYYSQKPHSQRYPPLFGFFYPNKANFIGVVGNFSSRWLVRQLVRGFKQKSSFPIEAVTTFAFVPGVDFSDHWSFWQEGYPAVMVTDTAFYRNPYYHSAADTYQTLDYENMAAVLTGLSTALLELAC